MKKRENPIMVDVLHFLVTGFEEDGTAGSRQRKAMDSAAKADIADRCAEQDNGLEPIFSPFIELFKPADTEAQLILLEVAASVCDAKEVDFLRRIAKGGTKPELRQKAQRALDELQYRLRIWPERIIGPRTVPNGNDEKIQVASPKTEKPEEKNLFQIDFELEGQSVSA